MRAILIDAETKTIAEIDFKGSYDEEINQLLGCRQMTSGKALCGSLAEGFDTVYVSNDPIEDDPRFWFQVDATCDPPGSHPIAGRGLVLGVDPDGENTDARISLGELRARVTFTQRKFRGVSSKITDEGLAVSVTAPIIDGADEG